ncbi:MAG: TolR protein [Labilithrix sp.]|nr:TolR protein [Labilithrix sp.]
MAGVSVGGGGRGGRREMNIEINMVPMIDLLMVTISFLLITAVWVQSSRLEANAQVPGTPTREPPCTDAGGQPCKAEPRLHVQTSDPTKFVLVWKEGPTVVRTAEVPREPAHAGKSKGLVSYPQLAARIAEEWKAAGSHRDPSDRKLDQAVVHTGSDMPYGEIVAVMDAIAQPKRGLVSAAGAGAGKAKEVAAFETTFAMD